MSWRASLRSERERAPRIREAFLAFLANSTSLSMSDWLSLDIFNEIVLGH